MTESAVVTGLRAITGPGSRSWIGMFRVLAVVAIGNVLGALAMAWAMTETHVLEPPARAALTELSRPVSQTPFPALFARAIFSGWAIALAVWTAPAAGSARVVTIGLMAYLTGIAHLEHLVAGSIQAFHAILIGELAIWEYASRILPGLLLGNLFGGVVMVAGLNHLAVRRQRRELFAESASSPRGHASGAEAVAEGRV